MPTAPINFPQQINPSISSYDFFDVAEGTAYINLYGCAAKNTITTTYFFTNNNSLYTSSIDALGGTELNGANLDFDFTFNKTKKFEGNVIIRIPIGIYTQTGTMTATITATLIHYDGSTETTISATQTATETVTGNGIIRSITLIMPLTGTQTFKAGETIRLTITGSVSGGSGSQSRTILHSPIGSQFNTSPYSGEGDSNATLIISLPLKLQSEQ